MSYVDDRGKVSRIKINGLGGDSITAMATGGGTVAFGTDSGRVGFWKPGTNEVGRRCDDRRRARPVGVRRQHRGHRMLSARDR